MTVAEAFQKFRSSLELSPSFQESISTHHWAVRNWIVSSSSSVETKLVGSIQRKTRIQPLPSESFDIDILVILGDFLRWASSWDGVSPVQALDYLETIVRVHRTYEKLGPETDSPAIVFRYSDNVKVELVPAYRDCIGAVPPTGRGYYVPKSKRWVLADYDYDADYYLLGTLKVEAI